MKKEYYKVYVKDENENIGIPIICETVTKIDTLIIGQAYIFRDLITGRIILPFYNTPASPFYNQNICTLTYDNINKHSYSKISKKKVLTFLKGINNEVIDAYQSTLNNIENKYIRNLTI